MRRTRPTRPRVSTRGCGDVSHAYSATYTIVYPRTRRRDNSDGSTSWDTVEESGRVRVEVDLEKIARKLGERACTNKSGRSTREVGIVVERVQ